MGDWVELVMTKVSKAVNQFMRLTMFVFLILIVLVFYFAFRTPKPVVQKAAPVAKVEPIHAFSNIDCEFDIEKLDVMSVERLEDGKTNIGYFINGQLNQWSMITTDAQHDNLVYRFKKKIGQNTR
jgi:hypothetical protein